MKSNNLAKMIGKRVVQSCITILLVTLFVFALIQMCFIRAMETIS